MDFKLLDHPHQDLINDIAFDYYGKRFATCSADKNLKIWSLDEDKGTWGCDMVLRAHSDNILRLSWAHPEFGQLIASCSEDGSVKIWEEQETSSDSVQGRWLKKAQISSSKKSVNDAKFCHHSFGLKIATASADGYVRVYQAKDMFDLRDWDALVCHTFFYLSHYLDLIHVYTYVGNVSSRSYRLETFVFLGHRAEGAIRARIDLFVLGRLSLRTCSHRCRWIFQTSSSVTSGRKCDNGGWYPILSFLLAVF